mmetsp:Transcript_20928/g.25720  ORF Transcript_20928/g.25720 Transcript_20928/m.25720 type:complete len:156 (+) Transcript_20928:178-645(+)
MNNLNPDFQTSFTVAYYFEREQKFKFEMLDIDNTSGSSYDLIGEIEVSMGNLMGAPRQTWQANLTNKGKNCGQIVVRTQSMADASNLVTRFNPIWSNVNNNGGGCMGMCSTRQSYSCRVLKEVPGDNNRFVVAHTVPTRYNSAQARMPMQEVSLA